MTGDDIRLLVERTRRQQGLPATITDPATLTKVAAVLAGANWRHREAV